MISFLSSLLFGAYIGLTYNNPPTFFIHLIILGVWFNFHPLLEKLP